MRKATSVSGRRAARSALAAILVAAMAIPALAAPKTSAQRSKAVSQKPAVRTPSVQTPSSAATLAEKTIASRAKTDLKKLLWPERPTVFAFYKPSSTLEREFVASLERETEDKMGFFVIPLQSGGEPIAQQHGVQETPTALVYDRRGRLVGRSSSAEEIRTLVAQALRVMRIDWAEEGDPRLDSARQMLGGQKTVPGILRTMSLRPDYLQGFMTMSMRAQFTDGFIDRRTKELIATHVSAINKCRY
jgi:hypothetical protein